MRRVLLKHLSGSKRPLTCTKTSSQGGVYGDVQVDPTPLPHPGLWAVHSARAVRRVVSTGAASAPWVSSPGWRGTSSRAPGLALQPRFSPILMVIFRVRMTVLPLQRWGCTPSLPGTLSSCQKAGLRQRQGHSEGVPSHRVTQAPHAGAGAQSWDAGPRGHTALLGQDGLRDASMQSGTSEPAR